VKLKSVVSAVSLVGDGERDRFLRMGGCDRSTFTSHITQIGCFSSSFLLTKSEVFDQGILAFCQSFHPSICHKINSRFSQHCDATHFMYFFFSNQSDHSKG